MVTHAFLYNPKMWLLLCLWLSLSRHLPLPLSPLSLCPLSPPPPIQTLLGITPRVRISTMAGPAMFLAKVLALLKYLYAIGGTLSLLLQLLRNAPRNDHRSNRYYLLVATCHSRSHESLMSFPCPSLDPLAILPFPSSPSSLITYEYK
jgi:hypothetical protein